MGNYCCKQNEEPEIRAADKQDSTLILSYSEEINEKASVPRRVASTHDATNDLQELCTKYTEYVTQITQIQALFRGFLVRRSYPMGNVLKPCIIVKYITEKLKEETNISSSSGMEPLEVDWDMSEYKGKLELRKPIKDEKGAIHMGYWNIMTNKKEGYGQEIYQKSGKYEGFFKDGQYEGKGRLINENGDKYAGMWKQGKANGFGTFAGVDGMKYTGEWKNGEHHGKGESK